ncbi:IS66 family transposase [Hominenteromicrobium sp.]|uniref:IS66 family transposase n=1 Tax=Hominenteromicrobium sp. TaxID=3073581 RepID=UPI003AB5C666
MQLTNAAALQGQAYCSRLFSIEQELAELPPEERYTQRLERSKPVMDALLAWAETTNAAPKSALGKAIYYLKEQWPYLIRVLEDGRLELSNSLAERSIKPGNVKKCAVGKHPKSEKHGNTAQISEVERSGTQENCGGIGSGCRLRLRPLPVLHRRQSQWVARIDPNAVVVDKNIAENDRFDLFSR